jgi:NADH-quinone oxidoreductase subunit A
MNNNSLKIMLMLDNSLVKKEYLTLLVFLIFAIILTVLIIGASYFLAQQNPDSEKLSAYECGFEPYEDTRHIFDVKFSVIAILFIIFDIEIMFLIPWCISISKLNFLSFWSMIDFLIELGVGFFYIWYVKALDWDFINVVYGSSYLLMFMGVVVNNINIMFYTNYKMIYKTIYLNKSLWLGDCAATYLLEFKDPFIIINHLYLLFFDLIVLKIKYIYLLFTEEDLYFIVLLGISYYWYLIYLHHKLRKKKKKLKELKEKKKVKEIKESKLNKPKDDKAKKK